MTTMLVVEDEILVRLAICEDLAAEGYELLTADNADQAMGLVDIGHPARRRVPERWATLYYFKFPFLLLVRLGRALEK